MVGFNRVMLMGNLTRDPQVKTLPNQTVLAEFGLACNRKFKTADGEDRQETTFVDCTAFGRQAEVIGEWCQKGKAIFVEGRLKYDSWDDKNGGGKRSKLAVVVENFQFIGGRDAAGAAAPASGNEYDQRPARPAPGRAPQAQPDAQPQPPISNEPQFKDDDIPF
jgi:single-strand DNA-binding protein